MRRALVIAAVVVVLPIAVLAVEVQLARTGDRLEDEDGSRPRQEVVRRGEDPLHVIWLGDSTTTGVGAEDFEESMAWRVAERITDGPVLLTVLGRSGDQIHEVLDHQLAALPDDLTEDVRGQVVFVSIGANDVTALTRRPTFEDRYRELVARVSEVLDESDIPSRVVLVGIPDLGTAPRLLQPLREVAGFRAAQLDDVIEEVARDRGLHHVELADTTGPVFASDPDRYFAGDDYHPTGDGHGVWADAIVRSLDFAGIAIGELGRRG
ncbi:MAG: SGNH/GDSL hydrolase family protein [Acidimicrobiia bacterium]